MSSWAELKAARKFTKNQIEQITAAAFNELITLIALSSAPQDAIDTVVKKWEIDLYECLSDAFSRTLTRAVGVAEIKEYKVGKVKLSNKIYSLSEETSRNTQRVIKNHVKGWHGAKKLALELYDGYSDAPEILEWNMRNKKLPAALRDAVVADRKSMQALSALSRRYIDGLKTPSLRAAYSSALDAIEKGVGAEKLERRLAVAFNEKMRYNATRIAQTELHKVWQQDQLDEIEKDIEITALQVRLSSTHPVEDICDVYANQDKYGLGKGVYPIGKAPVPPFHPFCRCRLQSKRLINGSQGKENKDSEREFLSAIAKKDEVMAAKIAGSRSKLEAVLSGADFTDVQNATRKKMFEIKTTGIER